MRYFSYNGKVLTDGTPCIGPDNRGLRYGDGLFETLKYIDGRLILLDEHLARLWTGMTLMGFELPRLFTKAFITDEILKLLKKNQEGTARVRVNVIRGDGGLYDPADHQPRLIIQTWPLAQNNQTLNANGLQLCVYPDALKSCDVFSNLKHNNYLCYLMGAIYAKEKKCNDAVILNQHLRVCDSTIANIFLVKDNTLFTPALAEGCVAGVMRQFLLSALPALGFKVMENEISIESLLAADEVFLCNAIYNIRWVAAIGDSQYGSKVTQQIADMLAKTKGNVFC